MARFAFTGGLFPILSNHEGDFMACVDPERHQYDYIGCQTDSNGRPGLPCELCQSSSPTVVKALPFIVAQHCRLCLNVCYIRTYSHEKDFHKPSACRSQPAYARLKKLSDVDLL